MTIGGSVKKLALLTLLLGSFAHADSTHYRVAFEPAQVVSNEPSSLVAGASTVDITPPPGVLPRAGYATWSTVGEGFRTRLYARTYYLRDAEGDSHLIVQTDLTTGSRILHTQLGKILAPHSDLDVGNITITSTHTHSGPGQIVGSQFYNKHISHQAGFATAYFEFVLERIANAALDAYRNAAPAKVATGSQVVWGLTRNRAIEAHVLNKNEDNKSTQDQRTFHEVNPNLHMVRIDTRAEDGSYQPLGAFASFAIHGTALPERERLFNADVWAYIHKDWEYHIEADTEREVHVSAFEGSHGDIAPANRFGMLGYIEAKRVGQGIARGAIALYDALGEQLRSDVDIRSAARHINIRKDNRVGDIELCRDAAAGTTLAGAPLEHTSPVIGHIPPFKPGSRRWGDEKDNCQGRKRILGFELLQPLLEPKDSFPDYVIFQLVQIGDMAIVPLPFEMTTEAGYRVERAVRSAYSAAQQTRPQQVMVTSLANGYTGYATTPEEYGRQLYEGGHTIYGKHTLPYLVAQVGQLSQDMLKRKERLVELPAHWDYHFESRQFLPDTTEARGVRAILDAPRFHHAQVNTEGHWVFEWRDVNASKIELHRPLLSIETRLNGGNWEPLKQNGIAVNDEGYDLAVRIVSDSDDEGMARYQGYWYNPLFDGEKREYRFVVQARDGQDTLYTKAFH